MTISKKLRLLNLLIIQKYFFLILQIFLWKFFPAIFWHFSFFPESKIRIINKFYFWPKMSILFPFKKIHFGPDIPIFYKVFWFLTKNFDFDKKFDFGPNIPIFYKIFRFLTKNFYFEKNIRSFNLKSEVGPKNRAKNRFW